MSEPIHTKKPHIRRKILIPLVTVTVGIVLLVGGMGWSLMDSSSDRKIKHEIQEIESLFGRLLKSEARAMESQIGMISINDELIDAWKAKDRDALLKRAQPIFKSLEKTYEISHFYFVDVDRTCFLRVHAPERRGDLISRFTMLEAEKNQQTSSGIELGPLGTFTLRTVVPWIVDDKLVGYLEVGSEITHLTSQLQWTDELDIIFTIDKKHLTQQNWETGSEFFGRVGDWDAFDDFVIMDKTFSSLPTQVSSCLIKAHKAPHPDHALTIAGHTYRAASRPLMDTAGETVGRMFILLDTAHTYNKFKKSSITGIIIILLAAAVLVVCFYFYTGKIDAELLTYRTNLEKQVSARTEELVKANEEVKKLTGFIPICSYCKKIRDDQGYWKMLEIYLSEHSDATFDHCICESCLKKNFPDIDDMRAFPDKLNGTPKESGESKKNDEG